MYGRPDYGKRMSSVPGTAIVILKSKEAGETMITVNADGVEAGTCVVRS